MTRQLFLLGGMSALDAFTPPWLRVCGERVAVLSYAPSEKHAALYRDLWAGRQVEFVAPDEESGTLDLDWAAAAIAGASAIFVAGGDTSRYHELYGTGPLRELICTRYRSGVPYAGVSAGAPLALEQCLIPGQDSGVPDRFGPGLGLLPGTLLGVHFAEWGGAATLHRHLRARHMATGWGLDDCVTLHFRDEAEPVSYGGSAFLIRLS